MDLPKDAFILFSVINTKLRDGYSSLDVLCDDLAVDKARLETTLAAAGFEYDENANQFK